MATNEPTGDNARKGAVRKRTQLRSKAMGETTYQAGKASGKFMNQKKAPAKKNSKASAARRKPVDPVPPPALVRSQGSFASTRSAHRCRRGEHLGALPPGRHRRLDVLRLLQGVPGGGKRRLAGDTARAAMSGEVKDLLVRPPP